MINFIQKENLFRLIYLNYKIMALHNITIPHLSNNFTYNDIRMTSGCKIPFIKKSSKTYLDKSVLILGPSNTGKTISVRDIIYELKDEIPTFYFIVSESSKKQYEDAAQHEKLIKSDISKKEFENMWKRQEESTEIYNKCHSLKNLKPIFDKFYPNDQTLKNVGLQVQEQINSTVARTDISNDEKARIMKEMSDKYKNNSIDFIRNKIKKFDVKNRFITLTAEEQNIINFMDFNPRIALVLDDITSKIPKWAKYFNKDPDQDSVFTKIFYEGRHNYITFILISHDISIIQPPSLRISTRLVLFCSQEILLNYITCKSHGIDKDLQNRFKEACKYIYNKSDHMKYAKIVYDRDDTINPIKYTVAKVYPEMPKVGDPYITKLLEQIHDKKSELKNKHIKNLLN